MTEQHNEMKRHRQVGWEAGSNTGEEKLNKFCMRLANSACKDAAGDCVCVCLLSLISGRYTGISVKRT